MGFKCKLIVVIVLVLLFSIGLVIIFGMTQKRGENYSAKLITVLNEQEKATVQDSFPFGNRAE